MKIRLTYTYLFWITVIGSFAGVIWENLVQLVKSGILESRAGLVFGPFNLVYGFGALAITVLLHPFEDKSKKEIFLLGALTGGAFEFLCSWLQEALFGSVSWNYTNAPLSIGGRTNVAYMIVWGLMALLWLRTIQPKLYRFISQLHGNTFKIITTLFTVFMIFNITVSYAAMDRYEERRKAIPAENLVDRTLDTYFPNQKMRKIFTNLEYLPED